MRLHFTLSPNTEPVPYDYQHKLTGVFHKWMTQNNVHDDISLYSLSWLQGGKRSGNGLDFSSGATWNVSFHNGDILQRIGEGALRGRSLFCGMEVTEIRAEKAPYFGTRHRFNVQSPVLARKQWKDGKVKHLLYSDPEADETLTQTLLHKMDVAALAPEHRNVNVLFDREYPHPKTKLVTIKGIHNRASVCPVIVEGTSQAVQFAWNVGIGELTGSGFGSLL